jgi:hypothetical protein
MTLLERLELIIKAIKYPNVMLEIWEDEYDKWCMMKWNKDRESFHVDLEQGYSREVYIEDIIGVPYKIRDFAQPEDR